MRRRFCWWLGNVLMDLGERVLESADLDVDLRRARYLEQRHTRVDIVQRDEDVEVVTCGRVVRFKR